MVTGKTVEEMCAEVSLFNAEELDAASRVLHGLAHPLRLGVMQYLCSGEQSMGDIQKALGCSQSVMSQQLKILEQQCLIQIRREGRLKYCSIRNLDLVQVFHCMRKHLQTYFKLERSL